MVRLVLREGSEGLERPPSTPLGFTFQQLRLLKTDVSSAVLDRNLSWGVWSVFAFGTTLILCVHVFCLLVFMSSVLCCPLCCPILSFHMSSC